MALLHLLWVYSHDAVPAELREGDLLISDTDEWIAARAIAWAGMTTDILFVYTGNRPMVDVEVAMNAALAQPGPPEAVRALEAQIDALQHLVPGWVPVEDEEFRERRSSEKTTPAAWWPSGASPPTSGTWLPRCPTWASP